MNTVFYEIGISVPLDRVDFFISRMDEMKLIENNGLDIDSLFCQNLKSYNFKFIIPDDYSSYPLKDRVLDFSLREGYLYGCKPVNRNK